MWFLQVDTLLLMLGVSLAVGVALRLAGEKRAMLLSFMPLVDLGVLWYVSEKLALFYVGYTLVTWGFTRLLGRAKRGRGLLFALLCAACLVPLCYSRFSDALSLPMLGLTMIGIAYNMLKAIDALYHTYYGGEDIPLGLYANYMLFFPVLTAGPIFRYRDFVRVWSAPIPLDLPRLGDCLRRLIRGLFKKLVLVAGGSYALRFLLGRPECLYISLLIPFVTLFLLFFDMSGYADMAIAMGGFMGITVPENFKKPFQAPSYTVFWRNWHATLSEWIRDHVFVLLNGKRLNRRQGALIGFVVMMVMALWHGFTRVYVIDGIHMGLFLAAENLLSITTVNKKKSPKWYFALRCALVFVSFALSTVPFYLTGAQFHSFLRGFLVLGGGVG